MFNAVAASISGVCDENLASVHRTLFPGLAPIQTNPLPKAGGTGSGGLADQHAAKAGAPRRAKDQRPHRHRYVWPPPSPIARWRASSLRNSFRKTPFSRSTRHAYQPSEAGMFAASFAAIDGEENSRPSSSAIPLFSVILARWVSPTRGRG